MMADYPGAIVIEARNYGYSGAINRPRAFCLHTPEEPADDHMTTPYYFARTTRQASTTYFVSFHGFVVQCVPEDEGAYANAVEGKPYPAWADKTVNLNLQTLSVEIEGYAATIHQTMPRGSAQWKALVDLMAHRCEALNIPVGRTFGHFEVSNQRSDPGALPIHQLIVDVQARMEGEMPLNDADRAKYDEWFWENFDKMVAENGPLVNALEDSAANPHLSHHISGAAIRGAEGIDDAQPSAVVQAINAAVRDAGGSGGDGSDHVHEGTVTSTVTLA